MKVLMLGASGRVGSCILGYFSAVGINVTTFRARCDNTSLQALRDLIRGNTFDFIFNLGGYTDVDGCETFPALAYDSNSELPGHVAVLAAEFDVALIHLSSDYVFGSRKSGFDEHDTPEPLNVYGHSKYLGELAIMRSGASYTIVRTSWLWSSESHPLIKSLYSTNPHSELTFVADQHQVPTAIDYLCAELYHLILNYKDMPPILHVAPIGATTKFHHANFINSRLSHELRMPRHLIVPISLSDLNLPADRPRFSILITRYPNVRLQKGVGWRASVVRALWESKKIL